MFHRALKTVVLFPVIHFIKILITSMFQQFCMIHTWLCSKQTDDDDEGTFFSLFFYKNDLKLTDLN